MIRPRRLTLRSIVLFKIRLELPTREPSARGRLSFRNLEPSYFGIAWSLQSTIATEEIS